MVFKDRNGTYHALLTDGLFHAWSVDGIAWTLTPQMDFLGGLEGLPCEGKGGLAGRPHLVLGGDDGHTPIALTGSCYFDKPVPFGGSTYTALIPIDWNDENEKVVARLIDGRRRQKGKRSQVRGTLLSIFDLLFFAFGRLLSDQQQHGPAALLLRVTSSASRRFPVPAPFPVQGPQASSHARHLQGPLLLRVEWSAPHVSWAGFACGAVRPGLVLRGHHEHLQRGRRRQDGQHALRMDPLHLHLYHLHGLQEHSGRGSRPRRRLSRRSRRRHIPPATAGTSRPRTTSRRRWPRRWQTT